MTREIALKRNILLYRLNLIFGGNGLTTSAIYFFYTLTKELTSTQALFLVGGATLTRALTEIPTGVIADKFSRKYSILIGYSIALLCWIGILFADSFWLILILTLFKGIGGSFISGADDALLYDSLDELGESKQFKSIYSISESIELVFFAITVLIGGLIANINLNWVIICHISFLTATIIFTALFTEPSTTKQGEKLEEIGYLTHVKDSLKVIFSKSGIHTRLFSAFVTLALISAVFKSTKNILSPVLENYGFDISEIGLTISLVILVKAIGAFIAGKIKRRWESMKEVTVGLAICIIGLLAIIILKNSILHLIIFILIIGLDNIILTNLRTIINDQISSKQRATILSLQSLFARSTEMLYLTSFGWFIDNQGIKLALIFTSIWLISAGLILIPIKKVSRISISS